MKQFSIGLFIITTLTSALLAGQAFGFTSFGGEGFTRYPTLNLDETQWRRGSTYKFESNATIFPHENTEIAGEKGTSIVFLDTRTEYFAIQLETGRVNSRGALGVHVNKLLIHIDGNAEIIHYSWKNEVEITLREGTITLNGPEDEMTYNAPTNMHLSTQTGAILEPQE